MICLLNQTRFGFETMALKTFFKRVKASSGRKEFKRATNKRDPLMPKTDQVIHSHADAGRMVNPHATHPGPGYLMSINTNGMSRWLKTFTNRSSISDVMMATPSTLR